MRSFFMPLFVLFNYYYYLCVNKYENDYTCVTKIDKGNKEIESSPLLKRIKMHETAAERERRLRQLGGGERWHHTSWYWYDMNTLIDELDYTNPCREMDIVISLPQVHRCTLGSNPLVKFTKYKFKF